ncbi:MAG: MerR family transcriptional regulator, mercuric resistance operon regulatory protein [Methyloprofundus sp.]|nr:MAG: MerR family transcriptional regulator, mercuric resistance operon regulatory protein [Methyloprofundus sp.]
MNQGLKEDNLFRLSILAEKTGISVHCIRTYVDQGLIQVSDRTDGGLLLFNEIAVERLRFIKTAREAGVPLAKISGLLAASDSGNIEQTNTSMSELNQYIDDTRSKVSVFEQSLLTFKKVDNLIAR